MSNDITLVLGATGNTGRRVTARLRLRDTPVRATSRSSRIPFDWFHPAGWDQVLRGVTTAYVVPVPVPGPVHDFVARTEAAGVRRLVLLSGHGADDWGDSAFGLDMRSAEDAVRGSALERTILRASNFAQNFDGRPFRAPLAAGEPALPAGAVPGPFIDLEDVADVAAAVLSEPGQHAGRVHELTGPRGPPQAEAVEPISRASGQPIVHRRISPAEYTATLVQEGWGEDEARHLTEMFVLFERGTAAWTSDAVATVLRCAPRTFEGFVLRATAAEAWRC
ncbi:NAD(P)H-binding protein [Streptomyces sp. TRM43335]|uniref:NAD(P)H-binding protein n=1 Tax=Streptomyces taklimakanensis TaxID=2569853 RepID=A0A6G2BJK8_9ACTN|nr:NAD(P)H-binding protein [Streptomyces taklimakanensis]MTE22471.1 NAD(P)H-binding protein [Streptomyces taklimakanensis]